MNKQAPTLGRILTMVLFSLSCFGLLLFLWLAFGGSTPLQPKGYRVKIAFDDATTLADQADVRTAGVSIGKVRKLDKVPKGGRTIATIELEPRYAPLRSDAKALLRQKTLLGETYIDLTLGTKGAPPVPENGTLPTGQVADAVEFDELLSLFDADTRRAFQQLQKVQARASGGQGEDLNAVVGQLPGFVGSGREVFAELERRDQQLKSLLRGTGTTFDALSRNGTKLTELVRSNARVMETLAGRRESLFETFQVLPTFLRESRTTLTRLQRFSRRTDPLLRDLEPVLRDTTPTFAALRRAAPDLETALNALPALRDAGRTGFPALSKVLRSLDPALEQTAPFLNQLNPILRYVEANQQTLTDFLNIGPSALAAKAPTYPGSKSNGHVLPQLIVLGSQSFPAENRTPDNRGNAYFAPGALSDPRLVDPGKFMLGNFDCKHVGVKPPTDTPGCFEQDGITVDGKMTKYPRIGADGG